jgi:hypothetical protein
VPPYLRQSSPNISCCSCDKNVWLRKFLSGNYDISFYSDVVLLHFLPGSTVPTKQLPAIHIDKYNNSV